MEGFSDSVLSRAGGEQSRGSRGTELREWMRGIPPQLRGLGSRVMAGGQIPRKAGRTGFELPFREAAAPAIPGSEFTLPVQFKPWLLLSGVSRRARVWSPNLSVSSPSSLPATHRSPAGVGPQDLKGGSLRVVYEG